MENNEGYILFNAEGKKPDATLAAHRTDNCTQFVVNGKKNQLLLLFAAIAEGLMSECNIPANILTDTIMLTKECGENVVSILEVIRKGFFNEKD